MASLIRWTWVWVNSRSWWGIGRPGMLWFIGLQRVWHDWATELNWIETGVTQPRACALLTLGVDAFASQAHLWWCWAQGAISHVGAVVRSDVNNLCCIGWKLQCPMQYPFFTCGYQKVKTLVLHSHKPYVKCSLATYSPQLMHWTVNFHHHRNFYWIVLD